MHREDISVVIAAYNAADTIGRAMASVAAQTVKPLEVIVIDDGSTDATSEVASGMQNTMNGIELRLFTQQNAGAGAARNRGLAEAKGTLVAFLGADDAWLAEKVERCMAKLDESNDVLIAHDFIRVEADGIELMVNCAKRFQDADDPFSGLYRHDFIGTSTVVARRNALLAVGGFDESVQPAQDFDLWLRVLAQPGATFTIFGETLSHHHVSARSTTTFSRGRLACMLTIAERHAGDLAGRNVLNLWFRVLTVHFDAYSAFCASARPIAAVTTIFSLPWRLGLSTIKAPIPARPAPGWLMAFFWLWVIVGSGGYIYRFQDMGLAALEMLTRK